MRIFTLIICCLLSASSLSAQDTLISAHIVTQNNTRIDGLILYQDWRSTPSYIHFKSVSKKNLEKISVHKLREFSIEDKSKFIVRSVDIDRTSALDSKLKYDKKPAFSEEILALEVLVEGDASLYQYKDGSLVRYFYETTEKELEQLVYIRYHRTPTTTAHNNRFKQQLMNHLKCQKFDGKTYENLDYKEEDLVNYFLEYHNCNNTSYVNHTTTHTTSKSRVTLRPRIKESNLYASVPGMIRLVSFSRSISGGLGVELEHIVPHDHGDFSILLEPAVYHYSGGRTLNRSSVPGGIVNVDINLTLFELGIGVRQYFPVSGHSNLFINLSGFYNIGISANATFSRLDGSIIGRSRAQNGFNIGFGAGYGFKERFSAQFQIQSNRNPYAVEPVINFGFRTVSMLFGYTLFD